MRQHLVTSGRKAERAAAALTEPRYQSETSRRMLPSQVMRALSIFLMYLMACGTETAVGVICRLASAWPMFALSVCIV